MDGTHLLEPAGAEPIPFDREANDEPLPGYRLLEPLGRGGFGEVWKCEAPGGLLKAIKFVRGGLSALAAGAPAEEEMRAVQRVKAVRHPFILSIERVESRAGELIIVLELADKNLHDLLGEFRAAGRPGVPRADLVRYLREAAEALDWMNLRHDLQHLDVKPRNLFLVGGHVKVGDFGLVTSLGGGDAGGPAAVPPGAVTPLYASPEVFQGGVSRHSDQYSLAIVYQELLTGTLPFRGKNGRQLMLQHVTGEPDLRPLPPGDRAAVARALSKDPRRRFASCTDFVRALARGKAGAAAFPSADPGPTAAADQAGPPAVPGAPRSVREDAPREGNPHDTGAFASQDTTHQAPCADGGPAPEPLAGDPLSALRRALAGSASHAEEWPRGSSPGTSSGVLRARFRVASPPDELRARLAGFDRQWKGEVVRADDRGFLFRLSTPGSFWQRCLRRRPGLEVEIDWAPAAPPSTEVNVEVRAVGCGQGEADELVQVVGTVLLESVCARLQISPDRRAGERLTWPHRFHIRPVYPDGTAGGAVECQGKDISLNGISFFFRDELPSAEVVVELGFRSETPLMSVPARILRVQRHGGGWFEVGAILLPPSPHGLTGTSPARVLPCLKTG